MTACPSCSSEVSPSSRFCSSCGAAISPLSQMPTGLAGAPDAETGRQRTPARSPVGRLASSDSIESGGYTPGTILSERYRVVGLLGRGGMGEVYRADDLRLGQPVALKFLPSALSNDAARLQRFISEVRIARQVSHPNVCRVYDIATLDGQHYLSMEYVDGEDLAALLKRIGRLPDDKALDVARQLCAGLSAAHDRGVLHRDLKPANVMIDGRGRVRITDFGLAVPVEEAGTGFDGTPAYMAPEQLAGKGASIRSDIYALGLILYEIYTGRKAYDTATLAEQRRRKEEEAPPTPSQTGRDIDPVVERVILRCLEKDPRTRPASVVQVASALPGSDPLAAAIAAGETPSPEMVAAAGEVEGLRPAVAWTCLGALALVLVLCVLLLPQARMLDRVQAAKPPDALVERAREVLRKVGRTDPPADHAFGFTNGWDYLRYVREHDPSRTRWDSVARAGFGFYYRESPQPLVPVQFFGRFLAKPSASNRRVWRRCPNHAAVRSYGHFANLTQV